MRTMSKSGVQVRGERKESGGGDGHEEGYVYDTKYIRICWENTARAYILRADLTTQHQITVEMGWLEADNGMMVPDTTRKTCERRSTHVKPHGV